MALTNQDIPGHQADNPAKVLIADDDEATRILLRMALMQWGYHVVEARDGEEAWKILQEKDPPQLLTLDWLMPKLDGISLCKRIDTELSIRPYIIFLTRMGGTENVIQGLEAGADEFIMKPFDLTELRIRIFAGERIIKYRQQIAEYHKQLREYAANMKELASKQAQYSAAFSELEVLVQESQAILVEAENKLSIDKQVFINVFQKVKSLQNKLHPLVENPKIAVNSNVKINKISSKSVPAECIIQENESVINMKRMQAFFGNNKSAICDFIKTFIALATEQANEINKAITNKDTKAAKYYFHLLGSAAGNSGMMQIYDVCGKGEESVTQAKWEEAGLHHQEITVLIERLSNELSSIGSSS